MLTKPAVDLRLVCLRANPAYELVLFDRLPAPEQQAMEALGRDPDGYGVLRPRADGRLSMKSVSRDTALLWLTLQNPAPLPRYVIQTLGDTCDQVIGRMVLDGLLEIESNGQMLSGPAAHALVCVEHPDDEPKPQGSLAALSRGALEYAAALETDDSVALSARLYMYNRVPVSPRWRRQMPDRTAVERHLGLEGDAVSGMLKAGWMRRSSEDSPPAWMAWQSPRQSREHTAGTTFKLYVSPACNELRAGFEATADAVVRTNALQWKVGADVYGLLRPDKIVVYFSSFADLQEAAVRILEKLAGCPAHGVPFTAEVGGGGLLSWGIDPATDEHSVPWLERESWRSRISNRLATALLLARSAGQTGIAACRFAEDRLRMEGIDTQTWAPTRDLAWAEPTRR